MMKTREELINQLKEDGFEKVGDGIPLYQLNHIHDATKAMYLMMKYKNECYYFSFTASRICDSEWMFDLNVEIG